MSCILTAVAVMACATLAVHMGLLKAVVGILSKVASCAQCASFWLTLGVSYYDTDNAITASVLALLMAYVSNWLVLALVWLSNKYDKLWQKIVKT